LDLERTAEVLDVLELLAGAAGAVRADREDAALRLDGGGPAERAFLRGLRLARTLLAPLDDRRDDLGDHIAGTHHHDLVPLPDVLALQVLLVVEGGRADRDAADVNRLEHGEGQEMAGPPHVPDDLVELGGRGRGRELPGDRPARLTARDPQLPLQTAVVDLD